MTDQMILLPAKVVMQRSVATQSSRYTTTTPLFEYWKTTEELMFQDVLELKIQRDIYRTIVSYRWQHQSSEQPFCPVIDIWNQP